MRRTAIALLLGLTALPPVARAQEEPAATAGQEAACDTGQALTPGLCLSAVGTFDAVGNVAGGMRTGAAAIGQVRLG